MAVGLGVVVLGFSSFAYLVIAGRELGPERFGVVALFWMALHTVGPGLFLPLEQQVARSLSGSAEAVQPSRAVLKQAATVAVAALTALAAVGLVAGHWLADAFFGGSLLLVLALWAGTAAMAASYCARGVFAGSGLWGRYGLQLGSDGLVRCLGAGLVALAGINTPSPYALVVVLALVVSTLLTLPGSSIRQRSRPGPSGFGRSLGWLLVSSLAGLALLNAAPLAVELLAGPSETAAAGNFVAALVIARIPLFLFSAIQASLLPALVTHATRGDRGPFRSVLRTVVVAVVAAGGFSALASLAAGPDILRGVFGRSFAADRLDLTLLVLATTGLMLITTFGQALIALRGYRDAAIGPLIGLVVFVLGTALLDAPLARLISVALLLGVTAATAALAAQVRSRVHRWDGQRA